jgi:hypothetical protein
MIAARAWPAYVVCLVSVVFMLGRVVPDVGIRSGPDTATRQSALPSVGPVHQMQTATPVVERGLTQRATPRPARAQSENDDALRDAWYSNGCHLNPGTPLCVMVSIAAQCELDPTGGGCNDDHDGDGCKDVAEFRAGFNPANGLDCLGSGDGEPAVNCLFLFADRDCHGHRSTSRPPELDCTPFDRDPTCDGFAP